MKKILSVLLLSVLLLSLFSCGSGETEEEKAVIYDYVLKDSDYVVTDEVTDYVVFHVRYVNKNGVTHEGDIVAELYPDDAPLTVANFQKLVSEQFYDGLIFHRVISSFVIQGGDPNGTGTGGSKETVKGEFTLNGVDNEIKHVKGTLSMARSSSYDSASSQFFIVTTTSESNSASLDGSYAAFGQVVKGMTSVSGIANTETDSNDKPTNNAVMVTVRFCKPAETETSGTVTSKN